MRRLTVVHVLLGGYCLGLCLSLGVHCSLHALISAILVLLVAAGVAGQRGEEASAEAVRRSRQVVAAILVATLFICAGLAVGQMRLQHLSRSALAASLGRTAAIDATLTDLPRMSGTKLSLPVRVTAIDGRPIAEAAHISLSLGGQAPPTIDPCGALVEGTTIHLPAVLVEPLPAPVRGAFDYAQYLERRGEHVALAAPLSMLEVTGRRGGLAGFTDRLRIAARAHLRRGLRPPVREVLEGMVLGDAEGVDDGAISDFRRSGLLHIMAVSGENVVLLCSMWSFALLALGVPRTARTLALAPIVAAYVVVTGASPSIVRAGVAGLLGLVAILASRPSDGWLLWLAPGAWLLTVNPNTLYDVSFQLSFAAVAGLLIIARPLTELAGFLPQSIAEQVGVTTAASLATAPVSMLVFGTASAVSVPANVVGGFVLGPIMFFGMLSVLVGFAAPVLCVPLNILGGLFIGFLMTVAHWFGNLSFAVVEWHGLTLGMALIGALLIEAFVVWRAGVRAGVGLQAHARAHLAALVPATALIVAAVLALTPLPAKAPSGPTVTFLDVGEGAATLVQVPDGPTILIDAGPMPLGATLRAHGVKAIDLLVLSHGHADHVAGLSDVIGHVPIGAALLPRPPTPSAALDGLSAQLAAAGCHVTRCTVPLIMAASGYSIRVLPTHAGSEGGNQGENDCALVVLVELGGVRALVTGDAEGPVLADLNLPAVSVVELPHHGSAGGLDLPLLQALHPSLAVISVGQGNRFGHPTAEMLDLVATDGVPCLRTDLCGDVVVTAAGGGFSVGEEISGR